MDEETSGLLRYEVDSARSKFTVQAFAGGLLAGLGHNPTIGIRDFSGEVQLPGPGTIAGASLRLVINARSLTVLDEIKDKDREEIQSTMLGQVLEISAYPRIVFQSTEITGARITEGRFRARVVGDLTMHGVTRSGLWIQTQVSMTGDTIRATGDFTIKQTDFKIKPVSVAGGTLKLKDELKFVFDVVGHKG
jgi:polyisoprenoid-binding protein YceI